MSKSHQQVVAGAVALLLLVASAGISGAHSHADGGDQSCTRCHTVQFAARLTDVAALSRPALQAPVGRPSETGRTFSTVPPSLTYRGPPVSS